ncbi:MAG: hypothetical protein JXR61_09525 [Prolixibacteraceae bacterium]|nr:hypothetical protein [Prolixibacteraceae bacterium]
MKNTIKLSVAIVFILTVVSCTEELVKSDYDYMINPDNAPAGVVSGEVSNESAVSALITGSVAADASLLDWGVVYYTATSPDDFMVKSAKKISNSLSFEIALTGLIPGTDYKCKTFALNNDGIAYGDELSFQTKSAQSLPFSISAEDPVEIWLGIDFTFIDADGDGMGWVIYEGIGLESYSWDDVPLTPENYVILPPVQLVNDNATISLDLEAGDTGYFEEKYKVIISTAPIINSADADAAIILFEEVLSSPNSYTQTIEIPEEYEGKVVWIGIGHFDVTDMYSIIVSSIKIE